VVDLGISSHFFWKVGKKIMFLNGNFADSDSLYETYLLKGYFTVDNWSLFLQRYVDCLYVCVHVQTGRNGPIQTIAIISARLEVIEGNVTIEDALDFLSLSQLLCTSRPIANVLEYTNIILNLIAIEGSQYLTIPMSNGRRVRQYLRDRRLQTTESTLESSVELTSDDSGIEDTQILDENGMIIQR
jgi:hypothetical protein